MVVEKTVHPVQKAAAAGAAAATRTTTRTTRTTVINIGMKAGDSNGNTAVSDR